jgi:hypothetical protein
MVTTLDECGWLFRRLKQDTDGAGAESALFDGNNIWRNVLSKMRCDRSSLLRVLPDFIVILTGINLFSSTLYPQTSATQRSVKEFVLIII